MKTNKKNSGIKVSAGVKSGGLPYTNHNRSGLTVRARVALKVKTDVRAGSAILARNHSRSSLKVKTSVRAGSAILARNHSRSSLKVKTSVRAGSAILARNHNLRLQTAA